MNDTDFYRWMRQVDAILMETVGMCSMDLPDIPYRDMFDDKRTAKAAAKRAIREASVMF